MRVTKQFSTRAYALYNLCFNAMKHGLWLTHILFSPEIFVKVAGFIIVRQITVLYGNYQIPIRNLVKHGLILPYTF